MKRWKSIRVEEDTKKLARVLSARAGVKINDFIKQTLEDLKDENVELFKERRKHKQKKIGFNFGF